MYLQGNELHDGTIVIWDPANPGDACIIYTPAPKDADREPPQ